jgi:hypothetical protein
MITTLEYYGGGVNVEDNTPALNAMEQDLFETLKDRNCILEGGLYRFQQKPNEMRVPIFFKGKGISATAFGRGYSELSPTSGFLVWKAWQVAPNSAPYQPNGGGIDGMGIVSGPGTAGGVIIELRAFDGIVNDQPYRMAPSYMRFRDLYVSYSNENGYNAGIFVNGEAAHTPGGQGVRDLVIDGCVIFASASTLFSLLTKNASGLVVQASGLSGLCRISGVGDDPFKNSTQCHLSACEFNTLEFEHCNNIKGSGRCTSNLIMYGQIPGFPHTGASNCWWDGPVWGTQAIAPGVGNRVNGVFA